MSIVLLVMILLGVAGVGFYFYSRSRAMEGEDSLVIEEGSVRQLESERTDGPRLERIRLDDILVYDNTDHRVRGILTYKTNQPYETEPRAVEYLLKRDGDASDDAADREQWLWVEARGDVALEIREPIDASDVPGDFSLPDDGLESVDPASSADSFDAPESLEWQNATYSIQDVLVARRTLQGEPRDRPTGDLAYFHYAGTGGDTLFVENAAGQLKAYSGHRLAEYEIEVLPG